MEAWKLTVCELTADGDQSLSRPSLSGVASVQATVSGLRGALLRGSTLRRHRVRNMPETKGAPAGPAGAQAVEEVASKCNLVNRQWRNAAFSAA